MQSVINDRLIQLSPSKERFDRAAPMYDKALHESGNEINLKYRKEAKTNINTNNNRRRNIVWFNAPYNETVKTNIGHEFLNLLMKHLPKHHWIHEICNKNGIKISYSRMLDMSTIILSQNKKLFSTLPKASRPPLPPYSAIAKLKPLALVTANVNKSQLCIKPKYPLAILPNYLMNRVLQILN